MNERTNGLKDAIGLMRKALALLDEADEGEAAIKLQHAISIATREPILRIDNEIDEMLIDEHFRLLATKSK